ncbi:hypothetical protein FQN54_003567 [Arachnomyces sp. PD_36]|nr:hypothetical protein FQN54_003567 [Arachnomyces sp. PD_36]
MAVIGLVIFTVGVAIFSAFHSVPIPHVRQDVDFPLRIVGSLGFGYVCSTLEKMAEDFLAIESGNSDHQPLGLSESPKPYLDALTIMIDKSSHSPTGTDDGLNTEETAQAPMTDLPDIPATTIVIIRELTVTQVLPTAPATPAYDGPVELMNVPQPKITPSPKAKPFTRLNEDVNSMVVLTYASLVVVFIAYLLFLYMTTGTAYKRTKGAAHRANAVIDGELSKFTTYLRAQQTRLDLGAEWVNKLDEQIQQSKDELGRQVQNFKDEVEREKDKLLADVEEIRAGLITWRKTIEKTCDQADEGEKELRGVIESRAREIFCKSKFENWWHVQVNRFKKLVAEAEEEVKAMVEDVEKSGSRQLGGLHAAFEQEKARLRSQLCKEEEVNPPFPGIATLRDQVFVLEGNMKNSSLQVQDLDARVKGCLSDLPELKDRSETIEGDIARLEQSLVFHKLALDQLVKDQQEMGRKMDAGGENPAASKPADSEPVTPSDSPRASLSPLPADLMADLLGESSSNEEEAAGGEGGGGKDGPEGSEGVVGGSEDAESSKPKRRIRPNKRGRAKVRAQAQAASNSSGAGGGGEADGVGSSGE